MEEAARKNPLEPLISWVVVTSLFLGGFGLGSLAGLSADAFNKKPAAHEQVVLKLPDSTTILTQPNQAGDEFEIRCLRKFEGFFGLHVGRNFDVNNAALVLDSKTHEYTYEVAFFEGNIVKHSVATLKCTEVSGEVEISLISLLDKT